MSDENALTDEMLLDYAAGALPAKMMATIAATLADDPVTREKLAEWQRQDAAINALYQPVLREVVPNRLSDVVRRAKADDAARGGQVPRPRLLLLAATIAALAIGTSVGWFARDLMLPAGAATQTLAANAMRAYATYVVEAAHPVEVEASNAQHLNAWMSKRLGHEIRPPDFAAAGFTLMGGRIVPSDDGAAALYMYENAEGQRITLYIAPVGSSRTTAFQFAEQGGTQSFYWMDRDLSYAVVGTIAREVLRRIAVAAYDQMI